MTFITCPKAPDPRNFPLDQFVGAETKGERDSIYKEQEVLHKKYVHTFVNNRQSL